MRISDWSSDVCSSDLEVHDFIRAQIWDDAGIPYWYRQNVLLFVRRERASELCCPEIPAAVRWPLRVVHPEQFERQVKAATSRRRVRLLPKAWKQYLKRRLRGTRRSEVRRGGKEGCSTCRSGW